MDAAELRAIQAPIKDRYRGEPGAALITLHARGALDDRGTLGVVKDTPVGFAEIRLSFDLDTDASQEQLDQLLKLTERYCVVYQTIANGPSLNVAMTRM